jgi:hypothetical protein
MGSDGKSKINRVKPLFVIQLLVSHTPSGCINECYGSHLPPNVFQFIREFGELASRPKTWLVVYGWESYADVSYKK